MLNLNDVKAPLYSQDGKGDAAIVHAKLFALGSGATWYVTEYDPKTNEAFGYVTGLQEDELGYISISELESLKYLGTVPRVERDLDWTPCTLGEVKAKVNA
jgi:hypothetical protein